ncbi:hypothetical protein L1987_57442 [Smallanthus sonchifolius]|uniref:Uncharacterized protein n=1 Tax=Smallanthus sonchifolius TaxID=185202 RepID=A0ACB9DDA3_9ASTR|nr:hypothetical protein L1987_57442 [Smallanthus sonchifolius]
MDPSVFFVKSFSKAFEVPDKFKDKCIRSMMHESAPGVYTFDMMQPIFCDRLLSEVEYFEKWACETRFRIMRPSTMHRFGVALDDFGMKGTLDWLMRDFISHISKILFPDVGGCSLDSNHGYVVEYGMGRDVDLGFHVDDSEVTLNVCLGTEFTGGDLFSEEIFSCSHARGTAIIHRGFHRHGALATTSGHRFSLVMWCRREMKKHRKGFSNDCGECERERQARLIQSVAARKKKWFGVVGEGDDAS